MKARARSASRTVAAASLAAMLATMSFARSSSALVPAGFHRTRGLSAQLLGSWRVTATEVSGEKYPLAGADIVWAFEPTQMRVRADGGETAMHYSLVRDEGGRMILSFNVDSRAVLSFPGSDEMVLTWIGEDSTEGSARVYVGRTP